MARVDVLQVIDGLSTGGAERLLADLVARLPRDRYRTTVAFSTSGPLESEIEAVGAGLVHIPRIALVDPTLFAGICTVIRRLRPQIVHTHLFKSDFHGRPAARLCSVPIVVSTVHNCDQWAKNPALGRLYGLTARCADRIFAVSDEIADFTIRHTGTPAARVHTIPNGVPLSRFEGNESAGAAVRSELRIGTEDILVGMVARLTPQKDHRTFLLAAALLRRSHPGLRFVVVGDGPLRPELEKLARDLGIDSIVRFVGVRRDVPAVLAALDLFVLSSNWEGLPVALLEAMAAACAPVATAVGGVPGVVEHGRTGLLVPPNDADALAEACLELARDPRRRQRLGVLARDHVSEHHSLDAMAQRITDQYELLLSASRSHR